jgi:colicin import membrane protein
MKKLYFLDEEEKQRILNIHESATKRQYLSEQSVIGAPNQGMITTTNNTPKVAPKVAPKAAADKAAADKAVADKAAADKAAADKKTTEDKAKKIQQYRQQIITKTSDTTKQIQKFLGLSETGVMDSGLLQKINEKLNGKPQEAPKADVTTQPKVEPLQQLPASGVKTSQLATMTPEQLTAGLQQKAAAATAGLK